MAELCCNNHPETRVWYCEGNPCPLCEAEQEIESLRRRLQELETQPKDRDPID